jgi:hypothetical protein
MKIDIKLLRSICKYPNEDEYVEQLYDNLVDMAWWSDTKTTGDGERENFLYEAFFQYYNVIMNGEVRETEEDTNMSKDRARLLLINRCKMQLDKELRRVENKDYEKYQED